MRTTLAVMTMGLAGIGVVAAPPGASAAACGAIPINNIAQIRTANVCECIHAHSLTEAKEIAARTWLPWWSELEWLNVEAVTESVIYD